MRKGKYCGIETSPAFCCPCGRDEFDIVLGNYGEFEGLQGIFLIYVKKTQKSVQGAFYIW